MKKVYSIPIVVLFILSITVFTLLSVFLPKSDFSEAENRELQTLPEISLEAINSGDFQKEYNDYLSDQFVARDFWVKAKTNIMLALGKQDINGVYIGRDGYLLEKYSENDFDSETVEYNVEVLTAFLNKYASSCNVKCAFIPSKGTAMLNKLPAHAVAYDTSYVMSEVQKGISEKVEFYDFTDELIKHNDEDIYFKTDHHWTQLGAYYAYTVLTANSSYASEYQPNLDNPKTVTEDFYGSTFDKIQMDIKPDSITYYDTGVKTHLDFNGEAKNSDSLYFPSALETKNKYEYFLGGNYARCDITTDVKNGKTLLLLKDSYSNALVPFLACNYEKIIMLDLRFYKDDINELISSEKPQDIFVINNTEKFMVNENMTVIDDNEDYEEDVDENEADNEESEEAEDDGELSEEELENERILAELEEEERKNGEIE